MGFSTPKLRSPSDLSLPLASVGCGHFSPETWSLEASLGPDPWLLGCEAKIRVSVTCARGR